MDNGSHLQNHPFLAFILGAATYLTFDLYTDFGKFCAASVAIWALGDLVYKKVIRPWRAKRKGLPLPVDTDKGDVS